MDTNTTPVPLTADRHDAVGERLQAVYEGIPGETVKLCERHRIGMARDNLEHLREIRDALAPYGKFKEWCQAVGVNYNTITGALRSNEAQRVHSKQRIVPGTTERSLPSPTDATEPTVPAIPADTMTLPATHALTDTDARAIIQTVAPMATVKADAEPEPSGAAITEMVQHVTEVFKSYASVGEVPWGSHDHELLQMWWETLEDDPPFDVDTAWEAFHDLFILSDFFLDKSNEYYHADHLFDDVDKYGGYLHDDPPPSGWSVAERRRVYRKLMEWDKAAVKSGTLTPRHRLVKRALAEVREEEAAAMSRRWRGIPHTPGEF